MTKSGARRRIAFALATAAFVTTISACAGSGSSKADGGDTLTINRFAGGDFTAYVIDEAGFFEKEGLDITWTEVGTGSQAVNALLSGSLDMLYGNVLLTSSLLADGRDVNVVSGGVTPPFSIIGAKGTSDEWPTAAQALQKGSLGVPVVGAAGEWYSRYVLQESGADADTVAYQGTGGLPQSQAALESGAVSAIFAGPAQDATLRAEGYPVIYSWMSDDQTGIPAGLTVMSDYSDFDFWATGEWMGRNAEPLHKFQSAMRAGAAWMTEPNNLDEIVGIVRGSATFNLPDMDDATFEDYVRTTIALVEPNYSIAAGNAYADMLRSVNAPGAENIPDASEWIEPSLLDEESN